MAKKSNKTEQVMKLITKENEVNEANDDVDVPETEDLTEEADEEIISDEIIEDDNYTEDDIFDELCNTEGTEKRCLINLTEHIVKEKAKEIIERLGVCTCHTCTLDVLALTLNSLPNKYITTDYGRLHLQLEIYKKQYETDVVSALTKACVRVKVSPRHGK